jgi:hypothetical protein
VPFWHVPVAELLEFLGNQWYLSGAAVTGRLIAGASLGAMTMPLLIGQLFDRVGPLVVMLVIAAALTAAVAIMTYVVRYVSQANFSVPVR